MKTYTIADLHGRADLLEAAFARIDVNAGGEAHNVVTLGDYIDRGPSSKRVIEMLRTDATETRTLICLRGNHEDIMLAANTDRGKLGWWLGNGGGHTLMSYGQQLGDTADVNVINAIDVQWVADLPLVHSDRFRVYVHAGVDEAVPLEDQDPHTLTWKIYSLDDETGFRGRHVVHGHKPYPDGPRLIRNRTNLDTMAWKTGRLVIGVFDDDTPGGPVELLEVVIESEEP